MIPYRQRGPVSPRAPNTTGVSGLGSGHLPPLDATPRWPVQHCRRFHPRRRTASDVLRVSPLVPPRSGPRPFAGEACITVWSHELSCFFLGKHIRDPRRYRQIALIGDRSCRREEFARQARRHDHGIGQGQRQLRLDRDLQAAPDLRPARHDEVHAAGRDRDLGRRRSIRSHPSDNGGGALCNHPDRRSRRAAGPGGSRSGGFSPPVRRQAVMLVGDRRHRNRQPGFRARSRMDQRIHPGGDCPQARSARVRTMNCRRGDSPQRVKEFHRLSIRRPRESGGPGASD